uniref:Predicted protein n=1 Tax=Hordeum vulgare subsp. vulgare TaxID=112509 RepID=F2CPR8_HORVV|nr:predicted protein [Hordeum vulgare subsp. vulgare]
MICVAPIHRPDVVSLPGGAQSPTSADVVSLPGGAQPSLSPLQTSWAKGGPSHQLWSWAVGKMVPWSRLSKRSYGGTTSKAMEGTRAGDGSEGALQEMRTVVGLPTPPSVTFCGILSVRDRMLID